MTDTLHKTEKFAETVTQVLEALVHNPQGVPTDPEVFDAVFNFIETALSDGDLDDVEVVADSDGFLRAASDTPFSSDE